MYSSYKQEDVTILLKDITGLVEPLGTKEREARIQSGRHYCEMLPIEYEPTQAYLDTFEEVLHAYAGMTAQAVGKLAQAIWCEKGADTVLVSLARAGTPIGILLRHYIWKKYGREVPHYTISIIRGRGIDKNAMAHILRHHAPKGVQFVDGWTGKGAIQNELRKAMEDYPNVDGGLAVLSDPAYIAKKCGTHEDFLIASSCLNATVSGLLSRTFLRDDIIGAEDFHGAACYRELADKDLTYHFINTVEEFFDLRDAAPEQVRIPEESGIAEVKKIAKEFGISDINLVKPGIGEATRVLLRRLPWKILVRDAEDDSRPEHLYRLAAEKRVEIVRYPLVHYRACGIIQSVTDA